MLNSVGYRLPGPRLAFAHGAEVELRRPGRADMLCCFGCYHPSRQNTFTGRVTAEIAAAISARTCGYAGWVTEAM